MVENLIIGDSANWTIPITSMSLGELPENLQAQAFIRLSGELIQLEASYQSGLLNVRLTPEKSESLSQGKAFLLVRLTAKDYQRSLVVQELMLMPGLEHDGFDHRTEAEKCLAQAEAALMDYTKGGARVKSYTIGSRATTFNSLQELKDLVEYWRKRVYLESCDKQGIDPRRVLVEFVK